MNALNFVLQKLIEYDANRTHNYEDCTHKNIKSDDFYRKNKKKTRKYTYKTKRNTVQNRSVLCKIKDEESGNL